MDSQTTMPPGGQNIHEHIVRVSAPCELKGSPLLNEVEIFSKFYSCKYRKYSASMVL